MIGRSHRGQDIITGTHKISTKKKTPSQLAQNDRLGMLSAFFSQIQELVGVGFKKFAKKRSALNSAFAFNYCHAFIEEEELIKINYPKIVYSRGPVEVVNCPSVGILGQVVTFSWLEQGENQLNRHNDKAIFLIYSEELKDACCFVRAADRSALSFSVELHNSLIGTGLHCYMDFQTDDGKLVGDSRYVGIV